MCGIIGSVMIGLLFRPFAIVGGNELVNGRGLQE